MRVKDLQQIHDFVEHLSLAVQLNTMAAIIGGDEINIEDTIDQATKDFGDAIAQEDYWTVARIVALNTYRSVSERILEGLKTIERSGGKL
jgi:hypothetical protein